MSAWQLIAVTAALGLFGGLLIWSGEEESRPVVRYGGAACLVGAVALILLAGPAHLPSGPADRVLADAPALAPSPADAPAATAAKNGTHKTASSTSGSSVPLPTYASFFPRGMPPPEPPPPNPDPTPSPSFTPTPTPTPTDTPSPTPTPTETEPSPSPSPTETEPSPSPTETEPSPSPSEPEPSPSPTELPGGPSPSPTGSGLKLL